MATRKTKKKTPRKKQPSQKQIKKALQTQEQDSTFFLKIVVFLILGSQWVFIERLPEWQAPIPVGLFLGLVFATHDHFQIDRKIEYVVLLVAAFVAFWLPIGLVIKV